MARSNQPPIEAAAGAAGPHVIDAFELLSNETRLAILLALWEAYDPRAEDNTVPFTELYDRIEMRDSGNFTYHLDKLTDHFVEKTDEGYRLRNAGFKIVRAVIAGTGLDLHERRLQPIEIPRSCQWCDAPVELSYDDGRLYQICSACEGNLGPESAERAPTGTLTVYDNFNPAGLSDRTPDEIFVAGTIEFHRALTMVIRGVCPECSGPIEESLHVCEGHDTAPRELCSTCDTKHEVRVSYVCTVCKHGGSYPAWVAVHDHSAVVAFYYEHGFEMTYDLDDPEACGQLWEHMMKQQKLLSVDPVRIRVTVPGDEDKLHLTLDENLDVIDVSRSNN